MVTITYDALNELVHTVAYEIEKATGLNKDTTLDLFALNDTMTSYLDHYGVQYEDEIDPEEANEVLRGMSIPKEV